MSDLTAFRDHARRMSTAEHKPECQGRLGVRRQATWTSAGGVVSPEIPPWCTSCVTDADRALWARLADEADNYLTRHHEEGLFA